jgi:Ni/Fe-hydrogenase 1 B-type cytochrome subunit
VNAKTHEFIRVYVWEAPVRAFHWINAACILVLCVTGFLIGHPPALMSSGDASSGYWFGTVRFIHFATAYVFVAMLVMRLYWAFAGNKFAGWRNFLPLTRRQAKDAVKVAKVELLQLSNEPLDPIGHNVVAYFTYAGTFLLALFSIVSGFALYAEMSNSWFPRLFRWIIPLFGSEYTLRSWHHAAMWLFVIFALIHIYLAIYEDYIDGHGSISSMIGGWKFMQKDVAEAPQAQGMSPWPRRLRLFGPRSGVAKSGKARNP